MSGCAGTSSISAALNCSAFIPKSYRVPVADIEPSETNTIGSWVALADARSGRLDEANGRTLALIEIADGCDAEQKRLARRPWWSIR